MTTLQLRIAPLGDRHVSRTIELAGSHTLADLHEAIQQAFELDSDHLYGFFLNNHAWDAEFGIWGEPDPGQRAASETTLASLRLPQNKRFLYVFDFGEQLQFELRVLRVAPAEVGPERPTVVDASGEAGAPALIHVHCGEPDAGFAELVTRLKRHVDAWDAAVDAGEAAELELEPISAAESEDELIDEESLDEQYALATELLVLTENDAATLRACVEHEIGVTVFDWLHLLPYRLSAANKAELAVALAERLLAMSDSPQLRASIPGFLAKAGRIEEARALLEAANDDDPEDPNRLFLIALAWTVIGDHSRAEPCLRTALAFAGSELTLREKITAELFELLMQSGREAEADNLLRSEAARMGLQVAALGPASPPVQQTQPKVGRNEPCPCGSAKKYKKCCMMKDDGVV